MCFPLAPAQRGAPDGQWVLLNDFNMIEDPFDSSGPSPLISGRQKGSWRLLKICLDLVDAFSFPRLFVGTHFTQRAIHSARLDQSLLDRFCISDKAHRIHEILQLEHVQNQVLSNHDPIILTLQIGPSPQYHGGPKNSTFFKASPETLQIEGIMDLLHFVWEEHPPGQANPTAKFALAWICLRWTLKELQEKAKHEEPSIDLLQSRLVQLKLEILEESDQFLHEEF